MDLNYPLKAAVNNSAYDGWSNKSLEQDLLDIYYSLVKVRHVLGIVNRTLDEEHRRKYFTFILEKAEHNVVSVETLLSCPDKVHEEIRDPFGSHPSQVYAIVNEFVRLLHVLEVKYNVMLSQQEAVEAEQEAQH